MDGHQGLGRGHAQGLLLLLLSILLLLLLLNFRRPLKIPLAVGAPRPAGLPPLGQCGLILHLSPSTLISVVHALPLHASARRRVLLDLHHLEGNDVLVGQRATRRRRRRRLVDQRGGHLLPLGIGGPAGRSRSSSSRRLGGLADGPLPSVVL